MLPAYQFSATGIEGRAGTMVYTICLVRDTPIRSRRITGCGYKRQSSYHANERDSYADGMLHDWTSRCFFSETKFSAPVIAQTLAVSRAAGAEALEASSNPVSAAKLNFYETGGLSVVKRRVDGVHGCTGVRRRRNTKCETQDR
jgi:hypothetical protein